MKTIFRFIEKIRKEFGDGHRLSPILKIIGVLLSIMLSLVVMSYILMKMISYIAINIDWIVFTIIIVVTVTVSLKTTVFDQLFSHKATNNEKPVEENNSAEILQQNYELLRNVLFSICKSNYQVLAIPKPYNEECLESDHHYIQKGNIVLYEYLLRTTKDVSLDIVKTCLEHEINLGLKRQSFLGISQQYYIYEGQSMSIIQVDSVENFGTYLKVYFALANDAYCMYKRNALSVNLLDSATSIKVPQDRDF